MAVLAIAPAEELPDISSELENTNRAPQRVIKHKGLIMISPQHPLSPADLTWRCYSCDLSQLSFSHQDVPCANIDDVLGGIGRGFRILEDHPIDDAYDPNAALLMNLGVLSGTMFMTGLRTYFHAYSPLKRSKAGLPSAMWTAGSGKFGTKLRFLGVEEVLFTGRAPHPVALHITRTGDEPATFNFIDARDLVGKRVNDKIQTLYQRFPEAHFAVLGPAGENYEKVRFASIALSTENQLKSGDPKPRFCGRGGIGGVMGSKNLLAIIADVKDRKAASGESFKKLNMEVARGDGSRRFRDKDTNNLGGTWANYVSFNSKHAMPEMNFTPTGTDVSVPLYRENVQKTGDFVIKDESCFRCGIKCHKNVYDVNEDGKAGQFRAKLDFEPLNLLASNLGLFDADRACTLVELVDEMGMDSISCGVTLGYAMEYNRRHQNDEKQLVGGLSYGDFEATRDAILAMGTGQLGELSQGTLRLSEQTGETDYAMQGKGLEYPAYLPQTNPGYPWALAGGHMSMRTFFILLNEQETDLDYWVDAITSPKKGLSIIRDDLLGTCKFSTMSSADMASAITEITGVEITEATLEQAVMRAFLRGYRLEKRQGFTQDDYVLPAQSHEEHPQIDLPYFNTQEFFSQLQERVTERFDSLLQEHGLTVS